MSAFHNLIAHAARTNFVREKQAGPISEYLSVLNPLNLYGGGTLGGAAALAMPTRSLAEQAEYDSKDNIGRAFANVLVPGMGAYNGFKRIGATIRSPEMKQLKARRKADKLKRELSVTQDNPLGDDDEKKTAGWKTELLGNAVNPINWFASPIGALAAAMTPTRTLDEQAAADEETIGNVLLPGRSSYNWFKRIGAGSRSPEMHLLQRRAKQDRLNKMQNTASKSEEKDEPAQKSAKVYDCSEPVEGMKPKMQYEEHKDLSPDEFSRENSESSKEAFMTPDFKKNMENDMARLIVPQVAGSLGGQAGGLLGLIGGGIHGAYDPGSYAGLDEKGNPALKRRSRLMGALRGAAGYGLGGALAGSIAGRAGGQLYANSKYAPVGQQAPANIVPLNKSSAALSFGEKVARVMLSR